jgi:hypothetical protein
MFLVERRFVAPTISEKCNETSDHGYFDCHRMPGNCYYRGRCSNGERLGRGMDSRIGYRHHCGRSYNSAVWPATKRNGDIRQRWSLRDRELTLRPSKICVKQPDAGHGGGKRSNRTRKLRLLWHVLDKGRRNCPAHRRRNMAGLGRYRSEANYHFIYRRRADLDYSYIVRRKK